MAFWRKPCTALQRFPRVTTFLPIRISTVDPARDLTTGKMVFRTLEETTLNLSRGGACIGSWELLSEGTRVALSLELARPALRGRALELAGRVVWTQRSLVPDACGGLTPPTYGIEFVEGSRFEFAALDDYLREIAPPPALSVPEVLPGSAFATP
jgi:hypothetical protein